MSRYKIHPLVEIVGIDIPGHVRPVIANFTLIAMTHNGEGSNYYTGLILQVTATDKDEPDLVNINIDSTETAITSGGNSPPFQQGCGSDTETCVRTFTIAVPKKNLLDSIIEEIELTATAEDAKGTSEDFTKNVIIPAESIPGCIHRDLGTKKNRYSLRLIYAWEESPDIDHTITGTLLTTAPDITE